MDAQMPHKCPLGTASFLSMFSQELVPFSVIHMALLQISTTYHPTKHSTCITTHALQNQACMWVWVCKHENVHAKWKGQTEKQLETIIELSSMQRRAAGRGHVGVQCLDFFSSHPRPFVPGIQPLDLWYWPSDFYVAAPVLGALFGIQDVCGSIFSWACRISSFDSSFPDMVIRVE